MQKTTKRIISLILAVILTAALMTVAPLSTSALEMEAPVFLGETVSLDSVIRLNFYVDTKGLDVSCNVQDIDYDEYAEGRFYFDCTTEDVEGRPNIIKCTVPVLAKAMSDHIQIELSYHDEEYNWYDVYKDYTVKEYLETLAEDAETYAPAGKADELRALCYATLNYGAAAQLQFDHYSDTLPLANEGIAYQTPAYGSEALPVLTQDEGSKRDFSSVGLQYYASSLGLYADTSYAVCFEDLEASGYVSVYDDRQEDPYSMWGQEVGTKKVGVDESGDDVTHYMRAYSFTGIAAKDLLNDIPVTII